MCLLHASSRRFHIEFSLILVSSYNHFIVHKIKVKQCKKTVEIYTDGSCLGNPGPGGYGIFMLYEGHEKKLSQGYKLTTNNRMEMLAAIVAL